MMERSPPTILSSRMVHGVVQSSSPGNLQWSADGQCFYLHRRGINIFTPYIHSTLPPPASLVDPHLSLEYKTKTVNRAKRKAAAEAADGDDVEMDGAESGQSASKRCRRPPGGELTFWTTGITVEPDPARDRLEAYGWWDIGDETNAAVTDREITPIKAVWSPSGMNDLGGCLLTVLTSHSQVSVYAPRADASSLIWDEIADLNILGKQLLPPRDAAGTLSVKGMLEMRAADIEWSQAIPESGVPGETGGILAVASRAGTISLWTYGAKKRFERVASVEMEESTASHLAWSQWTSTDDGVYEAQLAFSSIDGAVSTVSVTQTDTADGRRTVSIGEIATIDGGDQRSVTNLRWLGMLLVWSKVSTIHLWTKGGEEGYQWSGLRSLRLERVGGWASANALGNAVDFQITGSDELVVTLASLTRHVITSLRTDPALAPLAKSLRLSAGARDCFLDFVHSEVYSKDRLRRVELDDREVSAKTGGFSGIGQDWGLASWILEAAVYHNLNSSTEGTRMISVMISDLSGLLGDDKTIIERMEDILADPPRAAEQAPTLAIMPFVFRTLSSPDPQAGAQDLLDLCSTETETARIDMGSDDPTRRLVRSLWEPVALRRLRLRYLLAVWASTHFKAKEEANAFKAAARRVQNAIRSIVLGAVLSWTIGTLTSMSPEQLEAGISDQDSKFLRSSAQVEVDASPEADKIRSALIGMTRDENIDPELETEQCPACHSPVSTVSPGIAKCSKGHEWARCAITNILITTSTYRVCSVCPSISLFPQRHLTKPIPVSANGEATDWHRFIAAPSGEMVEQLLEIAVVCVMCGGRWVRSM